MAVISQEKLNEIRDSVNIVDIISSYIQLTPKGKNFFGVCPFHDDNNPSMSVSPDRQIYKCFSCGASGSVFKFVMDYENIPFTEAVKKMADIGGISVDIGKSSKTKKRSALHDIYDLSLKFYINNINTPKGKKAKSYLYNRGFNDDIIKEFQIGLALSGKDDLTKILTKKFEGKDIQKSGLIGKNNYGYYDIFMDRIMFPLYDLNGQVVAYSGRIYDKEDTAKYVNTKETEIFKKGELLYNYHKAKNESRKKNQVIIMEGFMDVIRAHSVGITNAIATMGTAVTKTQAHLIKRMAKEVILCFDGDDAGAKATKSCAELLNEIGVNPKVITLPDNLDPDEYIKKYGKEDFQKKIDNPINYIDFEISYLKKNKNLNNTEDKAKYISEIIKELDKIDDEILKELTIEKIVKENNIEENLIRKYLKNSKEKPKPKKKTIEVKNLSKYEKAEKRIVYFMLKHKDIIKMYDKKITYMPDEEYRLLAREIDAFYHEHGYINEAEFIDYIEGNNELAETLKKVNQNMYTENYSEEEIEDYINVIKEFNIKEMIKKIQKQISEETDNLKKAELAQKIINLKKEVE